MTPAEEHIWGLVCGFPGDRAGNRQLLMLRAYIDDSGRGNSEVLVLAGYIATVNQWVEFSRQWDRLLRMHYPLPYFKMNEMTRDLERCGWFYGAIERNVTAAISCCINTRGLAEACEEFPWPSWVKSPGEMKNPHLWAFQAIIDKLAQYQHQLQISEPVDFIFDNEAEKNKCLHAWDRMKLSFRPEFQALMGDTPMFRDDITTLPLQAADLYAWWVREWYLTGVKDGVTKLRFPWPYDRDLPRLEIRFDKEDFLTEFNRMLTNPRALEYAAMDDQTIVQAIKEMERSKILMNSTAPDSGKEDEPQRPRTIRSQDFKKLYTNSVNIERTLFDFRLVFGEISRDSGEVINEERISIAMSPQHAKVLARILVQNVHDYEQQIGEIKLPNQTLPSARSTETGAK